ncbi:MAG: type II secretion system F family protein [Patescibacteria group bacterium]|nr:type II secretion system F family protein [Patescibacteria group bacterium]
MQQFKYTVKDNKGETRKGLVEAVDLKQASSILHDRGFVVIKLNSSGGTLETLNQIALFQPVGLSTITTFTRQLSTMIVSGLNLLDSLKILERQERNERFKKVISELVKDVQGGSSLANAMGKHKGIFSTAFISLIKAGEASGKLDEVLLKLADSLEKEREFKSKVKGAMIYPVIILIGMVGVIFVMMIFVIPKLTDMFKTMNVDLPITTQILILVSNFSVDYWWLVLLMLVASFFGFQYFKSTYEGKKFLDQLSIKMPVFGSLNKTVNLATFSRTLGSLVGSGVPILDALKIAGETTDNLVYREAIIEATKMVEKGVPLSVPLSRNPNLPPLLGQMVSVGEETGKIDEVLEKVAKYFEAESEHEIKNVTTAMEPLILIFLGGMIAFLILSIILPIYQITGSVSNMK